MPGKTRDLLDAIVADLVVGDELKDIDLNAPASESAREIDAEREAVIRRESAAAAPSAPAVDAGLRAAWAERQAGNPSIALDDRDPAADQMASALIRYLVSYGLAESSSADTGGNHYVYTVTVNWERLAEFAAGNGIDLEAALDGGGRTR
ncbi:MAG: hypothetical protein ACKOWF_02570 [Chloroflexota bacterium]